MKAQFIHSLKEALADQKKSNLPQVRGFVIAFFVFILVFIAGSIFLAPEDKSINYHFRSEHGTITALSTVFLTMASAFSIATLVVHVRWKGESILPWVLFALGFWVLALDEASQLHEHIGWVLYDYMDAGVFRDWNDVIVILYGVVALAIFFVLLPIILRYKMMLECFIAAFLSYAVHTTIDSVEFWQSDYSIIIEESFKLFSGAFLCLGTFFSFLGALWRIEDASKPRVEEGAA